MRRRRTERVWVDGRCEVCGEPIYENAILVAEVDVVPFSAVDAPRERGGQHSVRPKFKRGEVGRRLYHRLCHRQIGGREK